MRRWLLCCAAGLLAVSVGQASDRMPAASIVVDVTSGAVLSSERADEPYPAGRLHHWLLLLAAQDQAALGTLPLDVPVAVSQETMRTYAAEKRDGFALDAKKTYLLSDLLKAVALTGADLAAVAAAEAMWGASDNALEGINEYGRRLGLKHTRFVSWRSDDPSNQTTAREAAAVVVRLVKPGSLPREWSALRAFPFDDGRVVLSNRMLLLDPRFTWGLADRTGSGPKRVVRLAAAGIEREQLHLLALSLGASAEKEVGAALAATLARVEQDYDLVPLVREGEPLQIEVDVEGGQETKLVPIAGQGFRLPMRRSGPEPGLQIRYQLPSAVTAPVRRGEVLGEVIIELDGKVLAVIPALSPNSIAADRLQSATGPTQGLRLWR